MIEELRDRIAAAIYDHPNPLSEQQCREVADAVIAELGLRQEWLTEQSSRLGLAALTKPDHPIATRTCSPWIALAPPPRRLWDIFAEADKGQ